MGEVALRLLQWARATVAGIPIPIGIIYLASTAFNLVAFNQGDLSHTVGSSYAYLFGHGVDFYDYNKPVFGGNDYFPTTYAVFAVWMAPVKLIMSPGIQYGMGISSVEVAWAKVLLLLLFWATFVVISKIAKELFPDRKNTQTTVRIAFLLSPLAAWVFNCFGQYDIIGVLLTSLGLLFYLRGDKWRFAIFFSLAISSKYFALIIFVPLLLLQFKKLRHIVLLGLVAISALVIEAAIYWPNAAFRDHTVFSLVGGKVTGAETQTVTTLVVIVFVIGCIVLWRIRPTPENLGPLAIYSALVAYGLMFTAVLWHPQWFIILTPFFALAIGYLRRPVMFLVWDSIFFLVFIWIVVNTWVANVDFTMVNLGALKNILGNPRLLGQDFYPIQALPLLHVLLAFYLFSPVAFLLIERARAPRTVIDGRRTSPWIWLLRVLTLPLVWTLPAVVSLIIPISTAEAINPRAAIVDLTPSLSCGLRDTPYGEVIDGVEVDQTVVAPSNGLSAISFPVATYARSASGELDIRLLDSAGLVRAEKRVDLATIKDNTEIYFVFPEINDSAKSRFTVDLSTSGTVVGQGIGLWGGSTDCYPDGTLTYGGKIQPGDLMLTTYYKKS